MIRGLIFRFATQRAYGKNISLSIADQAAFSAAGFALSWYAARSFTSTELATFSIGWQWSLGVYAVISEAIVVPAMVRASQDEIWRARLHSDFVPVVRNLGVLLLALGLGLGLLDVWGSSGILIGGITASGTAFGMRRAIFYTNFAIGTSFCRNVYRFSFTALGLAVLAISDAYAPASALALGGLAFAVGSGLDNARALGVRRALRAVSGRLSEGSWYVVATAIRIVGFSGGLLLFVARFRSPEEAALLAALLILAGPAQLLSSGLPLLFMAELGRLAGPGDRRVVRTLIRQGITVSITLGVALLTTFPLFVPWVMVTVGDGRLVAILGGDFAIFALLVTGIVLTSWVGAAMKALGLIHSFVVSSVVGTFASLGGLFLVALRTPWLAVVPYGASLAVMIASLAYSLYRDRA